MNYKQINVHPPNPMQGYPDPNMKKFPKANKKVEMQNMYKPMGVEVLYSENNDGEITIEVEPTSGLHKLVTAIDISSLYKEKRNKAIQLAKRFETLYHEYLVSPLCPVIMDGNKLYFQTEAPENGTSCWKAFCKKKFSTIDMLVIFRQMCSVLHYLHSNDIIHRDVHPTRFHCVSGKAKFNFIGMPYNFKKLLKKENFSGHINYSAPELIMEQMNFSDKVDIWSLGCCLYFLIVKKDPFEGKDPKTIKDNILKCNIDYKRTQHEPVLTNIIKVCLEIQEDKRPHAFELINYMNKLEKEVYGRVVSDETKDPNIKLHISNMSGTASPNTTRSIDHSFDNSFNNSFNSSFTSEPKFIDQRNLPNVAGPSIQEKKNLFSSGKKTMKLSSKSREFVKGDSMESPIPQMKLKQNTGYSLGPHTPASKQKEKFLMPPSQGTKNISHPKMKDIVETSQNEEDATQKDTETSHTGAKPSEDHLGLFDTNQYASFNTFNSSHLKDDNSFIDSSFNTMLNINQELTEGNKDFEAALKRDLEQNKLPNGYYKFNVYVPVQGELV